MQNFIDRFPNKASLIFVIVFFLAYFAQQPQRREDWPFTYFGMYKGGRINTESYHILDVVYHEKNRSFSVLSIIGDYYYADEKLKEVVFDRKEDFNNDVLSDNREILEGRDEQFNEYVHKDIFSTLYKRCRDCINGTVTIESKFWNHLEYKNYHKPDKKIIIFEIEYDRAKYTEFN